MHKQHFCSFLVAKPLLARDKTNSMNGENRLLVIDESVEFENNRFKFKTLGKSPIQLNVGNIQEYSIEYY